jgi:ATP-dependent DNA helicase RecG
LREFVILQSKNDLELKENQYIEFKSRFNDEVIETLTAFANTKRGGKVLVGVQDDGTTVTDFTIGKETVQKCLNEIKNKTQPAIMPSAEVVDYHGKSVIEFFVPEFPVKPVSFKGKYFRRVQNSNHQLSAM